MPRGVCEWPSNFVCAELADVRPFYRRSIDSARLGARMTQFSIVADGDIAPIPHALEQVTRGPILGLNQCRDDLDPLCVKRGLTCRHECDGDTAPSIFGQHGKPIDPALTLIMRPHHDADEAVAIGSHEVQSFESGNLPAKTLSTVPYARTIRKPAHAPKVNDGIVIVNRSMANRQRRPLNISSHGG